MPVGCGFAEAGAAARRCPAGSGPSFRVSARPPPPPPSVTGVTSRCRPSLPLNLRIPCDTEPLTSRAAPGPRLGHCSSPAPRAVTPYPLSSLRVQGNPHGSGCSGLRRARSPATAPSVFGHLGLPTTATSLCPGAPAVPPANGCQPLAAHDILRQSWGEGGGREGAFPDRREPGNDGQPWGPVVKGPRGPQVVFQCNQTGGWGLPQSFWPRAWCRGGKHARQQGKDTGEESGKEETAGHSGTLVSTTEAGTGGSWFWS